MFLVFSVILKSSKAGCNGGSNRDLLADFGLNSKYFDPSCRYSS